MKCGSTHPAYGGVTLVCDKNQGHPGKCKQQRGAPGYGAVAWPSVIGTCPVCLQDVRANDRRVGPFAAQRAGYGYAHEACYTQNARVHTDDKVKPKGKSAAARALFGGR